MIVPNVAEKVHLGLVQKETDAERMHGGIAPAFVKETSGHVQIREVVLVTRRSEKPDRANLKV